MHENGIFMHENENFATKTFMDENFLYEIVQSPFSSGAKKSYKEIMGQN